MGLEIVFRCENCETTRKEDVLPAKHNVMGAALEITREAGCCDNPQYVDCSGHAGALGFFYHG
ncbi:MAG: hypothetical protein ABEJ62_01290 [Candidatus Nanohaloarchaea archaeon]